MDKYTVDLDKVLNDFEYSELTEQNNAYSGDSSYYRANYSYDAQPYHKAAGSVKHSINNVFHSLNEYLNSDIAASIAEPIKSETDTDIETVSYPAYQHSPRRPSIEIPVSSNSDTITSDKLYPDHSIESFLENTFKRNSQRDLPSKHFCDPDYSVESYLDNVFYNKIEKQSHKNSELNDKNDSSLSNTELLSKIETVASILNNSDDNETNNLIEATKSDVPLDMNMSETLYVEEKQELLNNHEEVAISQNLDIKSDDEIREEVNVNLETNNCNEEVEVSDAPKSLSLSVHETNIIEIIKSDLNVITTNSNSSPKSTDDSVPICVDEMILESSETDSVEVDLNIANENCETVSGNNSTVDNEVSPKRDPIGFSHEDISDSEIERELNELEINEYIKNKNLMTDEEEIRKNLKTELEESSVININNKTDVIPVMNNETDVNNVNETNEEEKTNEIDTNEETKCVDTIVEKVINVVQISDKISVEITEKECEPVDCKTSSRPNSLEIDREKTINLIGNPGSTPYNNVYVENAFQAKAEGEASNSLSPTLSDISTSEASDSPNTSDSCNDTSLDDVTNSTVNATASSEQRTEHQQSENCTEQGDDVPATSWIGKTAPFWIPDSDTGNCQHCNLKFTVIKRRHHCRACGLVLCSKCCNMKYKLEFIDKAESRVCMKCYEILMKNNTTNATSSGSDGSSESHSTSPVNQSRQLNPANPMEYCSVVPPHQQVDNLPASPPSVMVPVGVLKRKGSGKSRSSKSVMFCDGIRPGCDLTELDYDFNYKESHSSSSKKLQPLKLNKNLPKFDPVTSSYIPSDENALPPTVSIMKSEISYTDCLNNNNIVETLQTTALTFALQRNLLIHVKIINMDCCINKYAWCFSTEGMITAGQDEIVLLLEVIDNEKLVPKDVFLHLNNIYNDAVKGTSITEMGLSIHNTSKFLDSKNHAGFLYVRPSFQCMQNIIIPKEPYLIGILIHRWETPWAKIFPLRLLLRLGAEYRYYPCPLISTRQRESVYVEIGHTIINLLADFRNFSYTLPSVRGLTIHMEEKNTTVRIPSNRYDQVMKALNISSDHILAFAGNFSPEADSHLVCIQDTHGNNENSYATHAINIHNKPRKVTGASFIVLNGALKSTSGLTAKSSIVEDGLTVQILPEQMIKLRNSLRDMKDFKIYCGCVNTQSDEFVNIIWTENDLNFNVGVVSPIDNTPMNGIPSIRVHNGKDYICNSGSKMIRWTEVFIIQSGDESSRNQQDSMDISKLSESISKATSQALVKYLDLLATNSFHKIGIRTTLHVENVSYLAGSNGVKLPPIYMKSLDNELIPVLHKITTNNLGECAVVLELVFHILNM